MNCVSLAEHSATPCIVMKWGICAGFRIAWDRLDEEKCRYMV